MNRWMIAGLTVLCCALSASAATLDTTALSTLPIQFDDGQGTTGTANIQIVDSTDASLDEAIAVLQNDFDVNRLGTVDGVVTVNSFDFSDYGINSSVNTRVLGLSWDLTPSGDVAGYQTVFIVSLQTGSTSFILNQISSGDPAYPFDATALSGNFGWVLQGPETVVDRRYIFFAKIPLDGNNQPVLGQGDVPLLEVADVVVMSLDARLALVPEPATLGSLAAAAAVLLLRRRPLGRQPR